MNDSLLIADCGATKGEWCFIGGGRRSTKLTQGISPYFLDEAGIEAVIINGLKSFLSKQVDYIFYYGTGCANPDNQKKIKSVLKKIFPDAKKIEVATDLLASARAVCGHKSGIACILGTGSNSCYYNGAKVVKNSPGLGYVLGDEGSGAFLGRKVIQYYLYGTFDEELKLAFEKTYNTSMVEILENVYKKPLPNRYLAQFTLFLSGNRGHYMVENIIEDGINEFFFNHLCKYREIWKYPVSFVGSVAYGFRDVIKQLCESYEFQLGVIYKKPMDGLIKYHTIKP